MSLKKCFMFVGVASTVGALAFGCSSSTTTVTPGDDGGAGGDGSTSTDAKTDKPSATGDTGPGSDSAASTCAYAAPTSFTPTWKPPTAHKNACNQATIDNFLKFCLGVQTDQGAACNSLLGTANGKACAACIDTPSTAANLGPLISHAEGYVSINTAGCVALAQNDLTAGGCGAKILAEAQCDAAACTSCKVNDDPQSLTDLGGCEAEANTKACQQYFDGASCGRALEEAGTVGKECFAGQSFEDAYNAIVPIFCLSSGTDASTD